MASESPRCDNATGAIGFRIRAVPILLQQILYVGIQTERALWILNSCKHGDASGATGSRI